MRDIDRVQKYDEDTIRKAIAMVVTGSRHPDIARATGVPVGTIRSWFLSGGNKAVSRLLYRTIVDAVLVKCSGKALKAIEKAFDTLPVVLAGEFGLRFFEMIARMNAIFMRSMGTKGGGKDEGEGAGTGGSLVLQQFIVQAPELAAKAQRLYMGAVEAKPVLHQGADEGDGQVKRARHGRPLRADVQAGAER
jgi:hypothetical protein